MSENTCEHVWKIIDAKDGFIIAEKCFHCNDIREYFARELAPPKEEYREGPHYYNFMAGAQTIQFDLFCEKCGTVVSLRNLMAIMQCEHCIDSCPLNLISQSAEEQKIWAYGALCYATPDGKEGTLNIEQLRALNEFFNARIRSVGKKILILPGFFRADPANCKAIILTDEGMLPEDENL